MSSAPLAGSGVDVAEELWALLGRARLTPAQRRIAAYVTEHPSEVATLSAAELAERTRVSQPSVSRFAKRLDFEGYPAFRWWLRRFVISPRRHSRSVERSRLRIAVDEEATNLQAMGELLQTRAAELTAAGHLLAHASTLVVLGLRASMALATHMAFFGTKIHPRVRLLTTGGSTAFDVLHQSTEEGQTALLVFALPRCPSETTEVVRVAAHMNMRHVVVTDSPLRQVAAHADITLPVSVGGRLVFDSQAAPMLLATALLDAMADAAPDRTQQRLETFERIAEQHEHFDLY